MAAEDPLFAVGSYGPDTALSLADQIWPVYQDAFGRLR